MKIMHETVEPTTDEKKLVKMNIVLCANKPIPFQLGVCVCERVSKWVSELDSMVVCLCACVCVCVRLCSSAAVSILPSIRLFAMLLSFSIQMHSANDDNEQFFE